jgi:3-deoxy-D-manno-octulosonic-acid transferase
MICPKSKERIWVHAVSVGEIVASLPVLRELRTVLPEYEIVLSTTTSSGYRTAIEQAVGLYEHLVYFPIDVARFQLSAMQKVRPALVAIMETELWMNFLWAAKTFDAKTVLVNGRISDRSFPRSMRIRPFYRALFRDLDQCLMQTGTDAERIAALGASSVQVLGNVKFDQALEGADADSESWRDQLKVPDGRPVIVVGSTRGEEEENFVLEALQLVGFHRVCVIHAPRHLERVAQLMIAAKAVCSDVVLRSGGVGGSYIIIDTYGELSSIYSAADIVAVGGAFANLGGQNLLQPLAHGKPVIHGPHMHNFRDVAAAAHAAGATLVASSPKELAEHIEQLLERPSRVEEMGQAAKRFVSENSGASRRYADAIASLLIASTRRVG